MLPIYLTKSTNKLSGPLRSEAINADFVIDYTDEGKIFGIEVLNLKLLDLSVDGIEFVNREIKT